jgi:aconitase B
MDAADTQLRGALLQTNNLSFPASMIHHVGIDARCSNGVIMQRLNNIVVIGGCGHARLPLGIAT